MMAIPSYAHHSFAAFFDKDSFNTISGVVTEYRFASPHTRIRLEVTTKKGVVEKWIVDGDSPSILTRMGMNGKEFRIGDVLKISGFMARNGANKMQWLTIETSDGTTFKGRGPSANSAAEQALKRRKKKLEKEVDVDNK